MYISLSLENIVIFFPVVFNIVIVQDRGKKLAGERLNVFWL